MPSPLSLRFRRNPHFVRDPVQMDPSALLVPLALVAMAYCKLRRAPMRGGADSDWTEAMDAIASGIRDSCGESIVFTEDIDETACCV